MANGYNHVMLLGNLGSDPEPRHTRNGTTVLNMRIATNERRKQGGEWAEATEWHDVVVFGDRADALARLLRKGSSVLVEGSLRTRSYEDRAGVERKRTEVVARDVVLAGGGQSREWRPSAGEAW